jgi:hypothetical protein
MSIIPMEKLSIVPRGRKQKVIKTVLIRRKKVSIKHDHSQKSISDNVPHLVSIPIALPHLHVHHQSAHTLQNHDKRLTALPFIKSKHSSCPLHIIVFLLIVNC